MSELKEFDDTVHDENEYETPEELYTKLCNTYLIHPYLDVGANKENSKCHWYNDDAFNGDWIIHDSLEMKVQDIWCNPPHDETGAFVKKADEQWGKYNMNIMMIVPANAICAHYFDDILQQPFVEHYRISGRITFLRNGKPAKFPSRNSYFVVIWRALEPPDEPEPAP